MPNPTLSEPSEEDLSGSVRAELEALPALAPFVVRLQPEHLPRRPASTGLAALDELLGGGFPRGRISELVGPRTSGRMSLLLRSLARATAEGARAALVDVTDGLDPTSAVTVGVHLERLLWVRGRGQILTGVQAADAIVRGGGFDVVAVELGDLPPAILARVPPGALVRLQRGVEGTPVAVIVAGVQRVARSLAAVAVGLAPRRLEWARDGAGLFTGLVTEARVIRARDRAPGASVRLRWGMTGAPGGGAGA